MLKLDCLVRGRKCLYRLLNDKTAPVDGKMSFIRLLKDKTESADGNNVFYQLLNDKTAPVDGKNVFYHTFQWSRIVPVLLSINLDVLQLTSWFCSKVALSRTLSFSFKWFCPKVALLRTFPPLFQAVLSEGYNDFLRFLLFFKVLVRCALSSHVMIYFQKQTNQLGQ